jgi:hypothetical protein
MSKKINWIGGILGAIAGWFLSALFVPFFVIILPETQVGLGILSIVTLPLFFAIVGFFLGKKYINIKIRG